MSERLQVHKLAPTLLPGAPHCQAAQHSLTLLGEQQSRAQCSQKLKRVCSHPRSPPTRRGELPHIPGTLEDKRDVGLERAFPHPQSCDPQPGSRIAAPRF